MLQNRLFYSLKLLEEGFSINEAALSSGFADYTTYLRAFKKVFNCLPSDF
ncbi:MAG: helix-turn-helix domain-containing protein, partial [Lachnospiraceae bacterium]|nr:helix-turn-helix domain-containing protein [Lachnospiraceae bacterium]